MHTTDISLFPSSLLLEVGLEGAGNALLDVYHLGVLPLGVDHVSNQAVSSLDEAETLRKELIVEVVCLRSQPASSITGILNRAVDKLLQFVNLLLWLTIINSLTAKRRSCFKHVILVHMYMSHTQRSLVHFSDVVACVTANLLLVWSMSELSCTLCSWMQ